MLIALTNELNLTINDLGITLCPDNQPNILTNIFSKEKIKTSSDLANALVEGKLTLTHNGNIITNLAQLNEDSSCWMETYRLKGIIQAKAIDFTPSPIRVVKKSSVIGVFKDSQDWEISLLVSVDSGLNWLNQPSIDLLEGYLLRVRGTFNSFVTNPTVKIKFKELA